MGAGWPVAGGGGADCDCAQPNSKTRTAGIERNLGRTTAFLLEYSKGSNDSSPFEYSMPEARTGFSYFTPLRSSVRCAAFTVVTDAVMVSP
jgi:hypothetical protein